MGRREGVWWESHRKQAREKVSGMSLRTCNVGSALPWMLGESSKGFKQSGRVRFALQERTDSWGVGVLARSWLGHGEERELCSERGRQWGPEWTPWQQEPSGGVEKCSGGRVVGVEGKESWPAWVLGSLGSKSSEKPQAFWGHHHPLLFGWNVWGLKSAIVRTFASNAFFPVRRPCRWTEPAHLVCLMPRLDLSSGFQRSERAGDFCSFFPSFPSFSSLPSLSFFPSFFLFFLFQVFYLPTN